VIVNYQTATLVLDGLPALIAELQGFDRLAKARVAPTLAYV